MPMMFTAAGAGMNVAGSLVGGFMGKSAGKKAAARIEAAMRSAAAGLQFRYDTSREYLAPYAQAGRQALSTLQNLFVSPEERQRQITTNKSELQTRIDQLKEMKASGKGIQDQSDYARIDRELSTLGNQMSNLDKEAESAKAGAGAADILTESPAFAYASKLVQRNLAAMGMTNSGVAIKQEGGLAAAMYGQQVQGLFRIAEGGQNAAGSLASVAIDTGKAEANVTMEGGKAAAGYRFQGDMAMAKGVQGAFSAAGQGASDIGGINAGQQNTKSITDSIAALNKGG